MSSVVVALLHTASQVGGFQGCLQVEILALSAQIHVLQRSQSRKIRLTTTDRVLWVWLARMWPGWRTATVLVKPATVVAWHRRGFRLFWTWKVSASSGGPPKVADRGSLVDPKRWLRPNPLWGAPRIHGELLKLGVNVSQAAVARYMPRRWRPPSPTWRTFLANHASQIMAADFFVVPTVTYRLLFVLVILSHERRRLVHVAVTAHPTAAWTAQQLREAFPDEEAPRFLSMTGTAHSQPSDQPSTEWAFARSAQQRAHRGTTATLSASSVHPSRMSRLCFRAERVWANGGSCTSMWTTTIAPARTWGSRKIRRWSRPVGTGSGSIVVIPQVGGLHHRYDRRAA
jgi:hypothetical protein